MRVRVLVAEGRALLREALVLLMREGGHEVVSATADGAAAVRLAAELEPDVVLIDLVMDGVDGVEAAQRITTARPRTQVVVLSQFADDESVLAAIEAGAAGYLTFDASGSELAAAVGAIAAGGAVLDPQVQRRLLERFRQTGRRSQGPPASVTGRELEVLQLIAGGLSNGEIAGRLHLSEATVKSHVNALLAKTEVRDRAQLVAYAYREGLVTGV